MLELRNVSVAYGNIAAVRGVDLDVRAGEVVAILGANGAGKTTIAKAIAGLLPFKGEITYRGRRLVANRAEANLRAGIALVPEGRGILARMSVADNLLLGIYARRDTVAAHADVAGMYERFPILAKRRHTMASLLSGGEQQMLAIARALLSKPALLVLDEPSLGLAPRAADDLFGMLSALRSDGLTVLLIEQKARQTLKIADRAYLVETGRVAAQGRAQDLIGDSLLASVFLGGAAPA